MKAIITVQWRSFIRTNLIWLLCLCTASLLITSVSYRVFADITPVIYGFAISPVLGMIRDCRNGWRNYEMMASPHKTRVLSRYLIIIGYSLVPSLFSLMMGRDLLTSLAVLLTVMSVPCICLAVYSAKSVSYQLLAAVLISGCFLILPLVYILSERILSLQMCILYHSATPDIFRPEISLLIPGIAVLISFLITYFGKKEIS